MFTVIIYLSMTDYYVCTQIECAAEATETIGEDKKAACQSNNNNNMNNNK